jgi:hypothetical protein
LELGSRFLPKPAWTAAFYFNLPADPGMLGTNHHAQFFSIEIGISQIFLPWLV